MATSTSLATAEHFPFSTKMMRTTIANSRILQVQHALHSLAVDWGTHRVYAPEQAENSRAVARLVAYDAVAHPWSTSPLRLKAARL